MKNTRKRGYTANRFKELNIGVSPKYITIYEDTNTAHGTVLVRIPGEKAKRFSNNKYGNIKTTIARAVAYRDSLVEKKEAIAKTSPKKTIKKTRAKTPIKELVAKTGAAINTSNLHLDSATNPKEMAVYLPKKNLNHLLDISLVNGDPKAFAYLGAATRNYMEKYNKAPTPSVDKKNAFWAMNKPKELEKKRKSVKANIKRKADISEITIDIPKLKSKTTDKTEAVEKSTKESLDRLIKKSLAKGIISPKSAYRGRLNKLTLEKFNKEGIEIDPRYLTWKFLPNTNHIYIRITTKYGLQQVILHERDFDGFEEMVAHADKIRREILLSGKIPKKYRNKEDHQKTPNSSKKQSIKRKQSARKESIAQTEQRSKSYEEMGLAEIAEIFFKKLIKHLEE